MTYLASLQRLVSYQYSQGRSFRGTSCNIDRKRERERCFAAAPFQGEAVPAMIVVGDEILFVRRPLPEGEGPQMIERERRIG